MHVCTDRLPAGASLVTTEFPMTSRPPFRVLILCTGNSARSIFGEYLLRAKGHGRFETYSAGSHPTGRVNPLAVRVLQERYGLDAGGARSKSWDEFRDVTFDFVITVCDRAREECPIFSGAPESLHWPFEDPATFTDTGAARLEAFRRLRDRIHARVMVFLGEGAYGSQEVR